MSRSTMPSRSLAAIERYLDRERDEVRARAIDEELAWMEARGTPQAVVTARLSRLVSLLPDEQEVGTSVHPLS